MPKCVTGDVGRALACRDSRAAEHLKWISIVVIFITSVIGISLPVLLARYFQGKPLYDKAVLLIKCFAAGVILSTSLVHVLPDAFDALSDCQVASQHPWKDYPFSGLVTLMGALTALLVDITASSHMEHGHGHGHGPSESYVPVGTHDQENEKKLCGGELRNESVEMVQVVQVVNEPEGVDEVVKLKQRLVSQVLEIGIIFHSVIIGVTMGMSQNQCTIKPLVAALAFHQIFEGMGLGGCIAQAGFSFARFSYIAICCLSILHRLNKINVEKAVSYIVSCKNLDGGFGCTPGGESHAGQIFCCVGALAITGSLHHIDKDLLGWWLCERQVKSGGLNGRPEKLPDVCYMWWVLSSLIMIDRVHWINKEKLVEFNLDCQDMENGGISDRPDDAVDVYHTYVLRCSW